MCCNIVMVHTRMRTHAYVHMQALAYINMHTEKDCVFVCVCLSECVCVPVSVTITATVPACCSVYALYCVFVFVFLCVYMYAFAFHPSLLPNLFFAISSLLSLIIFLGLRKTGHEGTVILSLPFDA